MGARVRARADGNLTVDGGGRITYLMTKTGEGLDSITRGTLEGVGPASLSSLRQALIQWRKKKGYREARVWVGLSQAPEGTFHLQFEDLDPAWVWTEAPPTCPAIFLENERLRIRIEVEREEKHQPAAVKRWLAPFLARHGATCDVAVTAVDEYEGPHFLISVDLDWSYPRGATVHDAWELGDEAQALLKAVKGEEIPRSVALDLLCAARWSLFYGQRESEWLEAKGEPYDHLGEYWRYELAKDVAALANMPNGGIIVIGLSTSDDGDGDFIDGHLEFELKRVESSKYRKQINQLVYPRVDGFEVRRIKGSKKGCGLAVLVIPPQPESSRPFMVQGLVLEGKLRDQYVVIPVRRGDETYYLDADAIHTRLSLGQQVIAGSL